MSRPTFISSAFVVPQREADGSTSIVKTIGNDGVVVNVGIPIWDRNSKENRTAFFTLKAFGKTAEKMLKMKLQSGSSVIFGGMYARDWYTDKNGNEKTADYIILDYLEYALTGSGNKKSEGQAEQQSTPDATSTATATPTAVATPTAFEVDENDENDDEGYPF